MLADVLALFARDLHESRDLLGYRLLLVERKPHGLALVVERGLRSFHARDRDRGVRVEQVLHEHHRVVSLLDRLPVEVRGQPRERLRVVVDRDRDVLLRRGELVCDLLVYCFGEPAHRLLPTMTWAAPTPLVPMSSRSPSRCGHG